MKLLKTISKFYLLIVVALSFSSSYISAEPDPELMRSSVVVVAYPEFSSLALKSFSWAGNHANISEGLQKTDFSVKELVDEAIKQAIKQKSYAFTDNNKGNLLIQYHVSLASELNDTALTLKYGLSPGLRANSVKAKEHERGTLVVDIIEPESAKVVWRGAVEVFTGVEDSQSGRQKRVNSLLIDLFSGIPGQKSANSK